MDRVVTEVGASDFSLTAIIARWHALTATFAWINCGHPPPLLVARDGTLEPMEGQRWPALGLTPAGGKFRRDERRLLPGEGLVLHTDGILKRRTADGGVFGRDGIERVLRGLPGAPAAAIVRTIQDAVVNASPQPLDDDAAVVVLRVAERSEG